MKTLMMKRTLLTPIAAGILLASTSVMAQQTDVEKGWFIQADVGQAHSHGQTGVYTTDKLSDKRRAWKASTGYRVNNNIAFALNYADLGVVEDLDSRSGLESIGGRAYGGSAIYNMPFSNSVNAHVKLGLAHFSGRENRLVDGSGEYTGQHAANDTSDNGVFYGAGMSFDVTENASLVVEWERYEFDNVVDVVSAGLRYTYGSIPVPVAVVAPVIIAPAPEPEPAPAPVVVLKPLQVNVYFDNDSSELTSETLDILAQAQRQLTSDRVESVNVSGFASAVGNADYNQALSERRAQAVVEHIRNNWNFEGSNLTSNDVNVVAHGEDSLINDEMTNNARDRRVMVKISFK